MAVSLFHECLRQLFIVAREAAPHRVGRQEGVKNQRTSSTFMFPFFLS